MSGPEHATPDRSGPDDDRLMARYASGDQLAARALAARHTGRVLALATRMLKDRAEAEDVAQEAMLRLWRHAGEWRPGEAKVSTWLYRVASNLCIDRMRKKRPAAMPEDAPEIPDDAPGALHGLATKDRRAALHDALSALPERQRAAMLLRHFAEMSNPDIAARLDVSVEAVESLLARGKRALAAKLAPRRDVLGYDA